MLVEVADRRERHALKADHLFTYGTVISPSGVMEQVIYEWLGHYIEWP